MRRTIKEVRDLIKEKIENAKIDLERNQLTNHVFPNQVKIARLEGEIDAYNDVLTLIETSHLLEDKNESKENAN